MTAGDAAAAGHVRRVRAATPPRIPLKASLDLTYRCNFHCRHCWLWAADSVAERRRELSTEEWLDVVRQLRALGVREWNVSGGEPLLREDFVEIFDAVTSRAKAYFLNTNGALVTPEIARLLRRPGQKMVSVYGATADVYDRVTGVEGGFDALVRGLSYLREAGAGFTVQLVPMRENYRQWDEMVEFARSWSPHYRLGAAWLVGSACGERHTAEIARQRLTPAEVVALEPPTATGGGRGHDDALPVADGRAGDDAVLAGCIENTRDLHVDAYGGASFCGFVKDPALRYDVRRGQPADKSAGASQSGVEGVLPGALRRVWEEFIPSLQGCVHGGPEYLEGCGSCDLAGDCRWCDVYGYLEHGRHGARVEYLCAVARENRRYKEKVVADHRRCFEIAGITVQVESDLPFGEDVLDPKFADFLVDGPGDDVVVWRHHFSVPQIEIPEGSEEVYARMPWVIDHTPAGQWIYRCVGADLHTQSPHAIAVFNEEHTVGDFYNDAEREAWWRQGPILSLTLFASDQLILARLLADRDAFYLHSGGIAIDGQGLIFVGHSSAGKTTSTMMVHQALGDRVRVLCDDRNIVRYWPQGFAGGPPGHYVHGTWSHGDLPECSSLGVPLRAVLFLEQDAANELEPLTDRRALWQGFLSKLVKPLGTADWWNKEMAIIERVVAEVPCYTMRFDKSGAIVPQLERLTR